MLIDNFSAGIIGGALAIVGLQGRRPGRRAPHRLARATASTSSSTSNLLPLASVIIEPAKVLFLNNAHQPRRARPRSASPRRRRTGQVDPVHAGVQPRPRLRHPAGLPVLRTAVAASVGPGRDHHPVPRRHPRDLLPVHPDEAEADPRRRSPAARPASPRSCSPTPVWSPRRRRAASSRTSRRRPRASATTSACSSASLVADRGVVRASARCCSASAAEATTLKSEDIDDDMRGGLTHDHTINACGHQEARRRLRRRHGQQRDAGQHRCKGSSRRPTSRSSTRPVNYDPRPTPTSCSATRRWSSGPARSAPDKPVVTFQVFLGDPAVTPLVKTIKDGGEVSG